MQPKPQIDDPRFEREERALLASRIRIATYVIAVPLVLGFLPIDYINSDVSLWKFALVRFWIIPIAILVFVLYRFGVEQSRFYAVPCYLVTAYVGISNSLGQMWTGYERSLYWGGLIMITIATQAFCPLHPRQIALALLLTYFPTFIMLAAKPSSIDTPIVATVIAILLSNIFIAILVGVINKRSRFREWMLRQEVQRLMDLQVETVACVAHDVRRPLEYLSIVMKLIEGATSLEALKALAAKSKASIKSISLSTNEMLINLQDAGNESELNRSVFSLPDLIDECLQECFGVQDKRYTTAVNTNQVSDINGDREKVKRVINNIINNAINATLDNPGDETVRVEAWQDGQSIFVQITNTGSSTKNEDPNSLLKKYQRGPSKRAGKGLGLSIVNKFIRLHDGDVQIKSDPALNTFSVTFSVLQK